MKTKAPRSRRRFASAWDEIQYLYDKLLYWLYERAEPGKARPFGRRLKHLLGKTPEVRDAILTQECHALVCELEEDLDGAIKHREREIRKIKRLHEIADQDSSRRDLLLEQYGFDDLSDRLDILAVLLHDRGYTARAIQVLREAHELCARHGMPHDGKDLLRDYLSESNGATIN